MNVACDARTWQTVHEYAIFEHGDLWSKRRIAKQTI